MEPCNFPSVARQRLRGHRWRMRLRGMLWALAGSAVAVGWSGPARACSCASEAMYIAWPRPDTQPVVLNTSVVLAGYGVSKPRVTLTAEDGTQVPLVERGHQSTAAIACAFSDYWFLAPAAPLALHTRYTLHAENPNPQSFYAVTPDNVSFVTGESLRGEAQPALAVSVYAAEHSGGQLLELAFESAWPEPLVVSFLGSKGRQASLFDSTHESRFWRSLGNVDCAEFTILDVTGREVLSERRCERDKCTAASTLLTPPCGGELSAGLSWSDWQQLPSCGSPTEPPIDIAPEPPIDVVSSSSESARCQLTGARTPERTTPAAAYLLACLLGLGAARRRAAPGCAR